MSALDELKKKEEKTDLDGAVIGIAYYEKQTTSFSGRATTVYSEKAAAELLALRAELTDAKARAKLAEENWHANEARIWKLEAVKKCAEKVVSLRGVSHGAWVIEELEAALKGTA